MVLAHLQGSCLNAVNLPRSLGKSQPTITRYIDFMVDLFLLRRLLAWPANVQKRWVKPATIYICDSGLSHALLNISDMETLLCHPGAGASWQGHVIESIFAALPHGCNTRFARAASGDEIDLVNELLSGRVLAIEVQKLWRQFLKRFLSCL